jgi:hypothetical protein
VVRFPPEVMKVKTGTHGGVVVKALRYKLEGHGFEIR